jgi:glycosyltransferase involved in cell wall biosynthesis
MTAPTPSGAPGATGGPVSTPRIANVCRVLWNGGVARAAIEQTRSLRAMGFDCDLIFLRAAPDSAYALPEGTRVLEQPSDRPDGAARSLSRAVTRWFAEHRGAEASVDLDLLARAAPLLRPYSVVVYNDQYAGLLGEYLRLAHGQPYVQMFHEFYPTESRGAGSRLLRPLADGLDHVSILVAPAIVTTSSRVAERIERFAPGRTFLARLGAPAATGPPVSVGARDRRSVFSVTVWDRGRHPELYLELARTAPKFRFVLAGIWTDPAHLEEFRRAAAGVPNLVVTGAIAEGRRVELMNASLLYLRVGYNESGPGLGGLEALSAGSLVIANRGLGLSEILTDAVDGFVLEEADPREISALLGRIDTLPEPTLEQMSSAARELAFHHSWDAHGRVLAQAVARAARHRGTGPGPAWADVRSSGGRETGGPTR